MILGFPLIPGLQLFGRSRRLEELSGAFRASGVHPDLIPDAVLLTIIKLLKSTYGKDISSGMSDTCDFFAYLLLGQEALKYNLQDSKVYAFEKRQYLRRPGRRLQVGPPVYRKRPHRRYGF